MMKAKNVVVGLKNGMTIESFCKKYQCSPEEFEERLKQLYGHNRKQLKSCFDELAANEKKAKRGPAKTEDSAESTEIAETVDARENEGEQTTVEEQAAVEDNTRQGKLKKFIELEDRQSRHVMALESKYMDLATEHRALRTSLRNLAEHIDELRSRCELYEVEFEKCLSRNAEVETQMKETSAEWNAERAILAETRRQIEELSVVTLCVYDSGEITILDECEVDVELDDSGWKVRRDYLLSLEECQELRLRDISTLAKLLKIAEHIECKVEVVCDNSELEKAFQKLRDCTPA